MGFWQLNDVSGSRNWWRSTAIEHYCLGFYDQKGLRSEILWESEEEILWLHSSFFCPVEILVEADNREPVLLRSSILVRIIKIQVKPVCGPGDL